MNEEPRFVDEEWRHRVGGDMSHHVRSGPVGSRALAVPMCPMVGHDPAHTGRCSFDASRNAGRLPWRTQFAGMLSRVSGGDRKVHVATRSLLPLRVDLCNTALRVPLASISGTRSESVVTIGYKDYHECCGIAALRVARFE